MHFFAPIKAIVYIYRYHVRLIFFGALVEFAIFNYSITENRKPTGVQYSESFHANTVRSVAKQLRQVSCGLILECMISARLLALIKKFLNAGVQFPLGVAWYSRRCITMKINVLHNSFLMHVSIINKER